MVGKQDFTIFCEVELRSDTISLSNLTLKNLVCPSRLINFKIISKIGMRKYLQEYGRWNGIIAKQNSHEMSKWDINHYWKESYICYDDVAPSWE